MTLKEKLKSSQPLLGTFVKTTHYHNTEVLSRTDLDVLCLDAEHAPFNRSDLDACVLAARSQAKPILIRIPCDSPSEILNALDIGATGIVVPHVKTAAQLQSIVQHCFFGDKGRGYAGSTRFAEYTTSNLLTNLKNNAAETCVVAQIEDLQALDELDAICQIENVDCIFIGTMDLTVALGAQSPKDASVVNVLNQIIDEAKKHHKTVGMFVADLNELESWHNKGVSLFLLSSDHGFILTSAKALKNTFDSAVSTKSE